MDAWSFIELARLVERKQAHAAAELALESRSFAEGWLAFGGRGSYVNKAAGFGLDRPITEPELDELVVYLVKHGEGLTPSP